MTKRKKKIYTTPKKNKHKNNNISITNFIKTFNNPRCNQCSSIIAIHYNRLYCGKCNMHFPILNSNNNILKTNQ